MTGALGAKSTVIGRKIELELLDSLWSLPRATLLILYGRRRDGKTRLLTHWLNQDQKYGLYWMAEATSAELEPSKGRCPVAIS